MSKPRPEAADTDGAAEQARVDIYGLLGRVLAAPPDADLLDALGSVQSADESPMAAAWTALAQAAAASSAEGVKQEYFDLFIGLGRGELVPYASWYLQGALMERPLVSLRQDLGKLGIMRADDVKEPEDHVAALCETMGLLISDTGLSLEQADFYAAHVGVWMKRFFADLENAGQAHFYRSVGNFGQCFMDLEDAYFRLPPAARE